MARGPLVYVQAAVYRWLKASGAVSLRLLKLRSAFRVESNHHLPEMKKSRFEEMIAAAAPEKGAPKDALTRGQIVGCLGAGLLTIVGLAWWQYGDHGATVEKSPQTDSPLEEQFTQPTFSFTVQQFRKLFVKAQATTSNSSVAAAEATLTAWDAKTGFTQNLRGKTRRSLEGFVESSNGKISQLTCRVYPLQEGTPDERTVYALTLPLLVSLALEPATGVERHISTLQALMTTPAEDVHDVPRSAGIIAEGNTQTPTAEITFSHSGGTMLFTFFPPGN